MGELLKLWKQSLPAPELLDPPANAAASGSGDGAGPSSRAKRSKGPADVSLGSPAEPVKTLDEMIHYVTNEPRQLQRILVGPLKDFLRSQGIVPYGKKADIIGQINELVERKTVGARPVR